jgi:peptidoglycan/LPS O-acetylase OafA/YrhL
MSFPDVSPQAAVNEPGSRVSLTLAQLATGHDNNLNLMRVLAALLVLASHSITLATGRADLEPGRSQFGLSLGDISVDIFFAISGFLVTGSLHRSNSIKKYAVARGLRIFPGLWVALILSVFVVSCWFSTLSPLASFSDARTWHYLIRNALIVTGVDFSLPGAFAVNPFPGSVNASLWTLPLEIWMYILLAVEWSLARRFSGRFPGQLLPRMLLGTAALLLVVTLAFVSVGHPSNSLRHATTFFIAAWMYAARTRIPMKFSAAFCFVVTMLGASLISHGAFEAVYRVLLPYLVLYLAYVPRGLIRRYNLIGDFSYGIYIYAFPLQQMTAAMFPGISVVGLFVMAAGATIVVATLSWYLVESPTLRLRRRTAT